LLRRKANVSKRKGSKTGNISCSEKKREHFHLPKTEEVLAGGASFENLHAIISSKLVRGLSFKKKDVTLLNRKWDSSSVAITLT
jgi:hypothetical protein